MQRVLICLVGIKRLAHFVAGLTNVDPDTTPPVYKQYHYVQYSGLVPASATASVSFPPDSGTFRYVIIQQQFQAHDALCIKEVEVVLRGAY